MKQEVCMLNNEVLLEKTKALAAEERKLTLEILHHLQEISRRRLFAYRGFASLFEYVTKELGYSDAAAMRRISAMKLLSEIPEVEEKIKVGAISLSNAAQAQKLFQTEEKLNRPFGLSEKKQILETLENKSSREAERELIQHSSQPISIQKPDRIKPVTPSLSEIRFVADQALLDQLEQIKGLLANKHPNISLGELISEMAKLSLEKLRPKPPKNHDFQTNKGVESEKTANRPKEISTGSDVEVRQVSNEQQSLVKAPEKAVPQNISRYIPIEVRRKVYQRDQGKCQYVDPASGRKCNSTHAIQYDHHIVPFALGGPTTVENLQIKCAAHNRIMAMKTYGTKKMSAYLKL